MVQWAGDATFAGAVISAANGHFEKDRNEGKAIPEDAPGLYRYLKQVYADVYTQLIELDLFIPALLDMEKFVNRTYDEATIRQVEALIDDYQRDSTADLLVCGFDSGWQAQIISLTIGGGSFGEPNKAIGSGSDLAGSQLAWQKTARSDKLTRVVYEVYKAKQYAELNVYVGKTSDCFVMFRNGIEGIRTLSQDSKDSLASAVEYDKQTPFKKDLRTREIKLAAPARANWEDEMRDLKLGPVLKAIADIEQQHPRVC